MKKSKAPTTPQQRLNLRAKGVSVYHDTKLRQEDSLFSAVEMMVMGSSTSYVYDLAEQFGMDLHKQPLEDFVVTLYQHLENQGIESPLQLCMDVLRA